MNYDFQKCPRIKEEAFQHLDVDDIDLMRIALIGPTGAGKTSLIGTNMISYEQISCVPLLNKCQFSIDQQLESVFTKTTRSFYLHKKHQQGIYPPIA